MAGTIFINYRKDDSNWNAVALFNELQKYFPRESIFKDSINIDFGKVYQDEINNALQACDVLLVLIGRQWLNIQDKNGKRRLDNPKDLLRIEIATALQRNIRVIPVLFDNVEMPEEDELPENLKTLSHRQFVSISSTRVESDIKDLAEAISRALKSKAKEEGKEEEIINVSKEDPNPRDGGTDIHIKIRKKNKSLVYVFVIVSPILVIIILFAVNSGKVRTSNDNYSPDESPARADTARPVQNYEDPTQSTNTDYNSNIADSTVKK
jgi:hypothetical protein